eukprot:2636383-Amphidinium_carterae.1
MSCPDVAFSGNFLYNGMPFVKCAHGRMSSKHEAACDLFEGHSTGLKLRRGQLSSSSCSWGGIVQAWHPGLESRLAMAQRLAH